MSAVVICLLLADGLLAQQINKKVELLLLNHVKNLIQKVYGSIYEGLFFPSISALMPGITVKVPVPVAARSKA